VLGGVPTAFRPLRHRDFRLLWTGLAVSLVGSGLWLVALGGIAVAALSPGVAILTGGLAYLVSAGCLLVMKVRPKKVPSTDGAPGVAAVLSDLREGFRYVRRTSWLWATLLFALALVLFII
jgi:hypothetical protein